MICAHCLYDDAGGRGRCESCGRPTEGPTGAVEPPLVGRARELARLDELMQQVIKNHVPRIVAVAGEPRSGRSRLLKQFRRRHDNDFSDLVAIRGYPVPGGRVADPFAPFGRLLRNAFRLDERAPVEASRQAVRQQVEALGPPSLPDTLRALGLLMGVRFPELRGANEGGGPEEMRRQASATCAWYLRRRAQARPLLLLLEGLSEATAEGRALLDALRGQLNHGPILMLCEVGRGDIDRFGDAVVAVEPLAREAVGELMARVAGRGSAPPDNLLDAAVAASRGRPEDVVHVVRTLEREGVLARGGHGWGVDPEAPLCLAFALTPEEGARRRLASLAGDDRAWLRRAAVVGTVFWRGALLPLARMEQGTGASLVSWLDLPRPSDVDAALERAVAAGVLHRMTDSGLDGDVEYAFTRPREQALLAGELEPDDRARMHAVVAQWLEWRTGPVRDQHLLAIAEHYRLGRNDKRAAFYYILAGDRARRRYANDLGVEAFERALDLLDERDALPLLDVFHALGALHALAGRHDLAEACFERMLASAWTLDHKAKAGAALNRLGRLHRDRGQYARARGLIEAGRGLFLDADDGPGVAASVDDLGQVLMRTGPRDEARRCFEEALAYRRAAEDARSTAVSLTNLAMLRRDEGDLAGAEATLLEAQALRAQIGDTTGLVTTLLEMAEVAARSGVTETAAAHADEALVLARRTGDRGQTARAAALLALLAAERGDVEAARARAEEAGALADALGDDVTRLRALRAQAAVEAARGANAAALTAAEDATRLARRVGDGVELGLALRQAGELAARLSGVNLTRAAASARLIERAAASAEHAGDGGDIDRLIEGALLEADASVPPEVTSLPAEARARLDAAVEAYADAVGALEAADEVVERARTLREMALLVAARGELARADVLGDRARAVDAERRGRVRA